MSEPSHWEKAKHECKEDVYKRNADGCPDPAQQSEFRAFREEKPIEAGLDANEKEEQPKSRPSVCWISSRTSKLVLFAKGLEFISIRDIVLTQRS
jgi:hypothetical protein